jgi:hypothetical protein
MLDAGPHGDAVPGATDRDRDFLDRQVEVVRTAKELTVVRQVEARAGKRYWSCWRGIPINFVTRDAAAVPEHWRIFNWRDSPLAGDGPRRAIDPPNAILNYLYALLETETRIACLTVGMDPGLGFQHTDEPNRDSLVSDLMEPARPRVDAIMLGLLRPHTFRRRDFEEGTLGDCRLDPHLAAMLARTYARGLGGLVGQLAEQVAQRLADVAQGDLGAPIELPTNLTQTRRRQAMEARGIRTRLTSGPDGGRGQPRMPHLPRGCCVCGTPLSGDLRYCDGCRPAPEERGGMKKGQERLRELRAAGHDPRTASSLDQLGRRQQEHAAAIRTWKKAGGAVFG